MPNYKIKFGASEAANLLQVDRDIIKTWAYKFSDYLNPEANPPKGKVRQFSMADVRVFAYVSMYWEDDPDIESIKYGLNSNSHYEYPFDEVVLEATPLFRELPEGLDETWKGVVFGGEFDFGEIFSLAASYKYAGDNLVDIAHRNDEETELFYPAIYNYRHSTELYLKAITGEPERTHDLLWLLNKLKDLLQTEFNTVTPKWFDNVIIAFNDFDPYGYAFRYGDTSNNSEMFVDMLHVKALMKGVAGSFTKIREEQRKKHS